CPADRAYLRALAPPVGSTTKKKPESTATENTSLKASDETWFQWRGPRRDGVSHETGLLDKWPAEGPPPAGRRKGLGGRTWSLVIGAGHIYTMGNKDGETQLVCLSLEDGKVVWRSPVGSGGAPNCTPTLDPAAGIVFGLSFDGDLLAADARTGKELWRKNFGQD